MALEISMTPRASNLIGFSLVAALVVAVAAGIALLAIAGKMPAHTDEQLATQLMAQYMSRHFELAPAERERDASRQAIIRLRTSKWRIYNAGLALTLVAPILLIATIHFRLWNIRRIQDLTTPRTRLRLLTIAGAAWFALLPAVLLDIEDDFAQDDITWFIGDTARGIGPLVLPPFFVITLVAITAFGRYVVLRNAHFPAGLWIWDKAQARRSLIWTTFYGLSGSMLFALAIKAAWDSPWFLPSLMVGLYVIASTRAAILNGSSASEEFHTSTTT